MIYTVFQQHRDEVAAARATDPFEQFSDAIIRSQLENMSSSCKCKHPYAVIGVERTGFTEFNAFLRSACCTIHGAEVLANLDEDPLAVNRGWGSQDGAFMI